MYIHPISSFIQLDLSDRRDTPTEIIKAVKKALNAGVRSILPNRTVSAELLIVDKETIHELNKNHRNIDRATDVLSFPAMPFTHGVIPKDKLSPVDEISGRIFIGSIVICADVAYEQASEYGHSPAREFSFLAVHSLLHLLGWDHEIGKEEEQEQFELQERILLSCGITR